MNILNGMKVIFGIFVAIILSIFVYNTIDPSLHEDFQGSYAIVTQDNKPYRLDLASKIRVDNTNRYCGYVINHGKYFEHFFVVHGRNVKIHKNERIEPKMIDVYGKDSLEHKCNIKLRNIKFKIAGERIDALLGKGE